MHKRAFMIHRPHESSPAKKSWAARVTSAAAQETRVAETTQRLLAAQRLSPPPHGVVVGAGLQRCRDALPYWDIYGRRGEPLATVAGLGKA